MDLTSVRVLANAFITARGFHFVSLQKPIRDLVVTKVYTISPDSPVRDATSFMLEKSVGCLIVTQGKEAVGIITGKDILQKVTAAGADSRKVRVKDIMSVALVVATIDTPIGEAARKMIKNNIKRLVVVGEDAAFMGLVTMTDLIRWIAKESEVSDALLDYLTYDVP